MDIGYLDDDHGSAVWLGRGHLSIEERRIKVICEETGNCMIMTSCKSKQVWRASPKIFWVKEVGLRKPSWVGASWMEFMH